jgi:hypothetical protein
LSGKAGLLTGHENCLVKRVAVDISLHWGKLMLKVTVSSAEGLRRIPRRVSSRGIHFLGKKEIAMNSKIKSILFWGLVIILFILGTPLVQMAL